MRRAWPLLLALVLLPSPAAPARAKCPAGARGSVAFASNGSLSILDLASCRTRVLTRHGVSGTISFSHDGRWISFSHGLIAAAGGQPRLTTGAWSPTQSVLVETTDDYGVVLKTPLGVVTRLLPDGWGALTVAWEPGGNRIAIGRTAGRGAIWIYDLRTHKAERVTNELGAKELPSLAGVSATGGWIAWWSYQDGGAYVGLDGVPLKIAAAGSHPIRVVPQMLSNRDFVAWCGQRLVLVSGASRTTTYGKSIVVAGPPAWRPRSLSRDPTRSWSSPACSPDGTSVVVAAGRNFAEPAFGLEQRSLWVLAADGSSRHRLTSPPPGQSDEAPEWSADGGFVLFVRVVRIVRGISAVGKLYLADLQGHTYGPLGTVEGGNYYGHYNLSVDWDRHDAAPLGTTASRSRASRRS